MHRLLDKIETKQKTRYGVIDFANRKQVFFYDLTHNIDPTMRLLLTVWRTSDDPTADRFSIFAAQHFPQIKLPEVSIVARSAITNEMDIPESSVGIVFNRV